MELFRTYLESSNIESIFCLYIEFRLTLETVSHWSSNKRNPDELLDVFPLRCLFIFAFESILHVTILMEKNHPGSDNACSS